MRRTDGEAGTLVNASISHFQVNPQTLRHIISQDTHIRCRKFSFWSVAMNAPWVSPSEFHLFRVTRPCCLNFMNHELVT